MKKHITLERLLIVVALIVIILLVNCNGRHGDEIIKVIPEYIKTTDTIVFNHIQEKKVYLNGKTIYIDSLRYIQYTQEKDTVKKDSMHIDAIAIREYDTIMEDDDKIKLELFSKVSGRMINSSIKYTIKEVEIKPVTQLPLLSIIPGFSVNTNKSLEVNAGLQFRNGFIISAGIDTNRDYKLGLAKTFILIK